MAGKKKRGGSKKKKKTRLTADQALAAKSVSEWVLLDHPAASASGGVDDFVVQKNSGDKSMVFELHSHSKFSDGFLSPSKLVERAHRKGVTVLALTDHDTMAGIPEALEASLRYGIKIIPGVEISTIFSPIADPKAEEESVHILAYYSSCGPKRPEELERFLANIRDGRFLRAKNMILKLNKLNLPLRWEHVSRIAGNGVAPGRLHVARAMVEAGYVENLRQAFDRYICDGGPAYCMGSEPPADEAIKLIRETGGLAVLAHPWSLKRPLEAIRKLAEAGLQGIEVYRSDGKLAVYSDLADVYGLLKIGGSDYHGRGENHESELGSVNLPVSALCNFLKAARPIWCSAIRENFACYAEEPSDANLLNIIRYGGRACIFKTGTPLSCGKDLLDRCLPFWLTKNEMETAEWEAIKEKLLNVAVSQRGIQVLIGSQ